MDMATTTDRKDDAMSTNESEIRDADGNIYTVDHDIDNAAEIREVVAGMLCHLASKMPYCADEDAQRDWDYLNARFGGQYVSIVTGISSGPALIARAVSVRVAAEEMAS